MDLNERSLLWVLSGPHLRPRAKVTPRYRRENTVASDCKVDLSKLISAVIVLVEVKCDSVKVFAHRTPLFLERFTSRLHAS